MTGGEMDCPECGRDDSWNDLGCMQCGLEFWPPSEAWWSSSTLTVAQRVANLKEDWCAESPEPASVRTPGQTHAEYAAWLASSAPPADKFYPPRPVPVVILPGNASPIEQQFWEAHIRLNLPELRGLVPQHKAGPYRMDFALPHHMVGIELEGLRNHSKTEDIARDCLRQRWLQGLGWHIIRIGGKEVHHDAEYCVRQTAWLTGMWVAS